jgi:mannose-1-phosphate guanylyltransferase
MKIVIFAGGVGTRLWPVSRKNTPKQFEKIIGEKSTLQQTVHRLLPTFAPQDVYIATGLRYKTVVEEQLPQIPKENFIFEPEMRDVGPAIGLVSSLLATKFPNEPVAILWSDHMVKNEESFRNVLQFSESLVASKKASFVFIGQKPRFANQNIGWIQLGEKQETQETDFELFTFKKLRYRPKLEEAVEFFSNKNFVWNLGYFVSTPAYLTELFKTHAPAMYEKLMQIVPSWGTSEFEKTLASLYPQLEKISFDDAILEKLDPSNVFVLSLDLGWSDVGAWEALKEALAASEEDNVTHGNVVTKDSTDSLLFNYTNQLVVGIDLKSMLIINTGDVLLVCPKNAVPKIKKLVESLEGTPHEHLT